MYSVLHVSMAELLVLSNYIDGEFVPAEEYIDSYDPSIGEVYARVPDSDAHVVSQAVQAATRAFEG